jgi:hypothetical protein
VIGNLNGLINEHHIINKLKLHSNKSIFNKFNHKIGIAYLSPDRTNAPNFDFEPNSLANDRYITNNIKLKPKKRR